MSTNIGFDIDGSNTNVDAHSELAGKFGNRPRYELDEIKHPEELYVDRHFEKKLFKLRVLNNQPWITTRLKTCLYPLLKRVPGVYAAYKFVRGKNE